MTAMPAPLRLLSSDDLQRIHGAALRVLDEVGMVVDYEPALEILDGAGARVDHQKRLVRFPPDLVERCLALVPRALTYHGRTPEQDFTLTADGDIYGRVPGGATGYIDLETGEHRRARIDDWREFATLVDALPNIHAVSTLHCGDVPLKTADLHSLRVLLEAQRQCILHNAFTVENQHYLYELMVTVAGSREALAARPLVHQVASVMSPLYVPPDDAEQMLVACEWGVPLDMPLMPIQGVSGPITVAGTLVQGLAEYLGSVALIQSKRPGHPMAFFIDPVVADLRTGNALFAAPEVGLLVAGIAQIGSELYGLPVQVIGMVADGFSTANMMIQKTQQALFEVLSGGRLVVGAGCIEATMSLSPLQLVIDDELMTIARRWLRGIEVTPGTLAVEAIARVGPRGDYMADDHTIEYVRSGEVVDLKLAERENRNVWVAGGSRTLEDRARERGLALLRSHEVPPLPDEVLKELAAIIAHADAKIAGVAPTGVA
jgi:trimethylamine--corrinoid protein Co-methyltransferase